MTGHAIIYTVIGVILVSSLVMFNIEQASTGIAANYDTEYLNQSAQNIAQSGVNMGLLQLSNNGSWRTGFSLMNLLGGKVAVRAFDTTFGGRAVVAIRAVGYAGYGTTSEVRDTSTAYVAAPLIPPGVKAVFTLNAQGKTAGGIVTDGRDHTVGGALIAGSGVLGIWTTSTFTQGGSSTIGGTNAAGTDFAPVKNADTSVIHTSQTYTGSFPTSPDSVMGSIANGYPEGTLKSIAQSGVNGSQYVTDPKTQLTFPLSGVTYIELAPSQSWVPNGVAGSGILVIHNSSGNAVFKQPQGNFTGLIIADDIQAFQGFNVTGAIVQTTPHPSSVQIGTSNGTCQYSRQAILNATSLNSSGVGSASNVTAWWE